MGYASYQTYLKSDLWASIRSQVLKDDPDCYANCGRKATQVHHGKYTKKELEGRRLSFLYPVCGYCHWKSEFREKDNEKLSPKQATTKLKQTATRNARELPLINEYKTDRADRHNRFDYAVFNSD